jgi:hypothetical protein
MRHWTARRQRSSASVAWRYLPTASDQAARLVRLQAAGLDWAFGRDQHANTVLRGKNRRSALWGHDVKLREIAHSRSGDKGNISNISVIAYDEKDYPLLKAQVTSARVKALFAGIVAGEVTRYELPNLGALNFVMQRALGGGVTRSLALDAHGKSLSSALLDLEIEDDFNNVNLVP